MKKWVISTQKTEQAMRARALLQNADPRGKMVKKAEPQGPQKPKSHVEAENPQRRQRGNDQKGRAGSSRE